MKTRFSKTILLSAVLLLMAAGCVAKRSEVNNDLVFGQNQQVQRQQIQVSQKVEADFADTLFNFYADENKTALDLLKSNHQVETKEFSGVGEFVESINGVKADSRHFWEFFVNEKSSNVGAGSYKPSDKDKLEWKLSEIK